MTRIKYCLEGPFSLLEDLVYVFLRHILAPGYGQMDAQRGVPAGVVMPWPKSGINMGIALETVEGRGAYRSGAPLGNFADKDGTRRASAGESKARAWTDAGNG